MTALGMGATPQPAPEPSAAGTAGTIEPRAAAPAASTSRQGRAPSRPMLESAQRPSGANGVWLEFNGARWYADGAATSFSPDRFEPVGLYRGFPVYRDKATADERDLGAGRDRRTARSLREALSPSG